MNKKLKILFAIVNQVKGFVRKVTQAFPITCPDCVDEDSLINMTIEGNCYQDGEPTYDNPIEIQSVGKRTANLLPYPYFDTTITRNGVTLTDNGDGTIKANGTATASTYFRYNNGSAGNRTPLKAGTYVISGNPSACGMGFFLYANNEDTSPTNMHTLTNGVSRVFTIDTDMYYYWYISVTSGTTVDNVTFSPMLQKCETLNNLLPYPYKDTTKTTNGITFTDNADGSVTLDGTYEGTTVRDFYLLGSPGAPLEFPTGTYVLTGCPLNGGTTTYRIIGMIKSADGSERFFNDVGNGYVFEVPEGGKLWLSIRIGADLGTVSGLTFRPCVTKVEVEYEPYGYKIPIVAETENLFVEGLPTAGFWTSYVNGDAIKGYGNAVSENIKTKALFKANHTYTLSFDMEMIAKGTNGTYKSAHHGLTIYSPTLGQHILNGLILEQPEVGEKVHINVTATMPDNLDEITLFFYYYTGRYVDENGASSDYDLVRFTNIKIEEADCETEPIVSNVYLKEPLRGINTYTDKLDVNKEECTRNVKTKQLDKNSTFLLFLNSHNVPLIRHLLGDNFNFGNSSNNFICSHYESSGNNAYYGYSTAAYLFQNYLGIYHEGITTLDEYRELLGDEIIELAYVLAEPITEKIIAPNIPTFKHGTTYSIATTVQPLSGTVEYYSTTKGE